MLILDFSYMNRNHLPL
uniref:Uncharacterized protein n=1 Tax=Rhizophora mucronata TaxID=61149 RepID=A0A2P2NFF2_RHIMU